MNLLVLEQLHFIFAAIPYFRVANVLYHIMLCYVMLCYVMLCCVMLFYVMLCFMLCYNSTIAIKVYGYSHSNIKKYLFHLQIFVFMHSAKIIVVWCLLNMIKPDVIDQKRKGLGGRLAWICAIILQLTRSMACHHFFGPVFLYLECWNEKLWEINECMGTWLALIWPK
jgi:hypothetical protein